MAPRPTAPGPLAGLKLVEFAAIGPTPLAVTLLADLGADVIRIARPANAASMFDDMGGPALHRGRRYVRLDLKDPAARDQALHLIAAADALVEGLRPGVMEKLGLGPDPCLARNPRLVYARMTGWGQSGPLAGQVGHDINYIGLSGALHAIGDANAPPTVPLNVIGDYGGGAMFLVAGVLAAVMAVRGGGPGQVVDVAMSEGSGFLMSVFYALMACGHWRDARGVNLLDGAAPFYRCYACADGRYVAVGALEPAFFAALLDGLGLASTRFQQYDIGDWPEMAAVFAERFKTRARDDWAAHFDGSDACVTPVLALGEAPNHPHQVARGGFFARDGIALPAPAPRFAETPAQPSPPSQEVGLAQALAHWRAATD
ncbi:MAG: alpha-methylacyl-CoA racemase [Sphingomonadales bacterium]